LVDCNLVCARSYGAESVENVIGRKLTDLFGTSPNSLDKLFRDLIEGGYSIIDGVGIEELPSGKKRYFLNNGHSVIENNKLVRIWGTFRDITDRKKAEDTIIESEKKLQESEEMFRSITEHSSMGISIAQDNQIKYVNKQAAKMLGFTVDEMSSWNFNDILKRIHPKDLQNVIENIDRSLNNAENALEHLDYRVMTKSGKYIWTDNYGANIMYEGKPANLITSVDITDIVNASQKLRESEEKFRTITEQSLMGTIIIQDGRVIYVNNAELNIMEYTALEMLGWTQEDLLNHIHPEDKIKAINRGRKRQEGKVVNPFFQYRIVTKSGKHKNVEVSTKIIEFNEKPASLTYVIDVTDKMEAEKRYKNLIDNLADIILELNLNGSVIFVSPQCYDILGYQPSEIIGKNAFNFIYTEDTPMIAESMKKAFMTKETISVLQYRLIHKNGEIVHASAKGKYVNVGGNEKFIVAIRDITLQKKIEQELESSEEKYRLLFDNSPVGIGLSTIEGEILDSNDAMVELTGYTAEDLNNAGVNSIYADPSVRSKIIKTLQEEGKLHDYDVTLRRKDNSEFFGSVSFDLLELSGKRIIQTSLRDISKNKIAEQELLKLNKLKSELLRRTSHELKTPLVSIKGFSDLLLQVHRDKLEPLVISILNEIKQGCLRLETLIADILKTSELESGTIQLHKSEEDLSFLVRLCINEIKGLSKLRNQTINLELQDNLITQFEKEQVHQVISNLLNNAIKYTPPGGIIEVKSEIKNNHIVISIKDNGIGFTYEEKGRLFKQFGKIERYGQGLDIIPEGSGLGLYISKKIVELHDGEIWVESEGRNKGSTFFFSLPLIARV
jgi:PAS domain S-box-containing protein